MDHSSTYRAAYDAFQSARMAFLKYTRLPEMRYTNPQDFNLRDGVSSDLTTAVFNACQIWRLDRDVANRLFQDAAMAGTTYAIMTNEGVDAGLLWKLSYAD